MLRKIFTLLVLFVFGVVSCNVALAEESEFKQYNNGKLKMVVVGSSVAFGSGATDNRGWSTMLKEKLEATGRWQVLNKCIGGNNTSNVLERLDRDVLAYDPDFVVIGLSLANEGLLGNEQQRVYDSFRSGLRKICQVIEANGAVPVICNCYPQSRYDLSRYELVQKMNLEIASWPVASINFLAAVDNGLGQWSGGYFHDDGHPNDAGHREMFMDIPVSMFDCWLGNPELDFDNDNVGITLGSGIDKPLECKVANRLNSFSMMFDFMPAEVKAGVLASFNDFDFISVNEAGKIVYEMDKYKIVSDTVIEAGKRYRIALTFAVNQKQAELYINGVKAGSTEVYDVTTDTVVLGGSKEAIYGKASFANVCLWRGALTDKTVEYVSKGNMFKSSLQLFSPLDDTIVNYGGRMQNYAPTESFFTVK